MNQFKKLRWVFLLLITQNTLSQTNLTVIPETKYQTVEGWGASLCWWANVAGGWSDAKVDSLCTWITSPTGLNLNVFRYNIGGGENPAHSHFRFDAYMPGFKATEASAYNWGADANQRRILLKLKAKRNDCIFEAFSNSPPYWMTQNDCSGGKPTPIITYPGLNNLKDDHYTAFADYLTDVVKYYHDTYGVTFRTLEPFNEPEIANSWVGTSCNQEGCAFSPSNEIKLMNEVYSKLSSKGMLSYCTISSNDANNIDDAVYDINQFISAGIMSKISQFNTHSYKGSQRSQIQQQASQQGKRLWQSETGPLNSGITTGSYDNNLYIGARCIDDMVNMKPVAWCDWQILDQGDEWGLIHYDNSNQSFWKNKNFYTRMQTTRFIKQGYIIVNTNQPDVLAAINPASTELVLVFCNQTTSDKNYNIALNMFGSTGSLAKVYRTTQGYHLTHWSGSAYNVYTYQTKTGLANGTYTAKVWVKSSGGQNTCFFEVKDFGGQIRSTITSNNGAWTLYTIPNIKVINGQCTIDIYSDSPANNYLAADNFEFYNNTNSGVNLMANPGLDNDFTSTQTPSGWSETGSNVTASYSEPGDMTDENCSQLKDVSIYNQFLSFTSVKKSTNTLVIPVTAAVYYKIKNRNTGEYIHNEHKTGKAEVSSIGAPGWWSAQWALENSGDGYTLFRNRNTGEYMNIQNNYGYVQVNAGNLAWWNEQWLLEDAGSGYKKFKNRSNSQYMHIENMLGYAQYSALGNPDWWSAQWIFTDSNSLLAPALISGDNQSKFAGLNIFPNPSNDGIFNLTLHGMNISEKMNVEIFDMNGKLVYKLYNLENKDMTLNTKLKPGLYMFKATSQSQNFVQKILIEK